MELDIVDWPVPTSCTSSPPVSDSTVSGSWATMVLTSFVRRLPAPPPSPEIKIICKGRIHRAGEGCTQLPLAVVVWPSTTHPFRVGAPFIVLTEPPRIFEYSLRFFHVCTARKNTLLFVSLSWSAFCVWGYGAVSSARVALTLVELSSHVFRRQVP